jgi:hypothetical protein
VGARAVGVSSAPPSACSMALEGGGLDGPSPIVRRPDLGADLAANRAGVRTYLDARAASSAVTSADGVEPVCTCLSKAHQAL